MGRVCGCIGKVDSGPKCAQSYNKYKRSKNVFFGTGIARICVHARMQLLQSLAQSLIGSPGTLLAIIFDQCQKSTTISSALMLYSYKRYLLMLIVRADFGLNILNPPHPVSLQPFDVAIISRFANSGQFDNTFFSCAGHRSRCCVEQVRAEVVSATTRRKNNMQVDFRGVLRPTKTRIADDIYPRAQPLVSVHSLKDCRRCLLTRACFDMPPAYTIRIQNAQICVHSCACDHAHPSHLRTLAPHIDNMAHLF